MKRFIKNLFAKRPQTAKLKDRRRTLKLETLTDRTLMAATITASLDTADGILRIEGTYGDDQIHIRDGLTTIRIDGVSVAVTDGGVTTQKAVVSKGQISQIVVAALDGNDRVEKHDVTFTNVTGKPIVIHGGMGNDTLIGGKGNDWIYGESGVDSIDGGLGSDRIYGDANPVAAKLVRGYNIDIIVPTPTELNGKSIKWLLPKYEFGGTNSWYYITSTGDLFHYSDWDNDGEQVLDSFVQSYDPSYFEDIRPLELERGLYDGGLYYNWGLRDEKWFGGIGDSYENSFYFITPVGEVIHWDGLVELGPEPSTGELLTTLDFAYHADPRELVAAATDDGAGDVLAGGEGFDTLFGGGGNDSMDGDGGRDVLYGGDGTDTLRGGSENDVLAGENDDDELYGNAGNDELFGCFINSWSETGDTSDVLWGGSGNDTMTGGEGGDFLYGGLNNDVISGNNGSDRLEGNEGHDIIYGGWWMSGLEVGDANDTLVGGSGNDTMGGGDGTDVLYGGENNDLMTGNNGNDYLEGNAGRDTLYGCNYESAGELGDANDTIFGGTGNDSLIGGDGADSMIGQHGNDVFWGNDGADVLWGGEENDSSVYLFVDRDTMFAGEGADWLLGGGDADEFHGGIGNDSIRGNTGRDTMYGDEDADDMAGGPENDTMRGGIGRDKLWGEGGNDQLFGDDDDDELNGGDQRDTLDGGYGTDLLRGDEDWDTFREPVALNLPFAGQEITDVDQEASPTCATLASIAAARRMGHDFRNQITVLGNNFYRVRLYPGGRAKDVTVFFDGTWTDNDPWLGGDGDYWVIILHRARMQQYGVGWTDYMTDESWETANKNSGGRLFDVEDALQMLTGKTVHSQAMSTKPWQDIVNGFRAGCIMVAATKKSLPASSPLLAEHAYAVVDAYIDVVTDRQMVTLYNPHGSYEDVRWDIFAGHMDALSWTT